MLLFLKNLLFTVVVPGTVAGYGPWLIARGCGEPFGSPAWLLLASGFFIIGGIIYLWCIWDFATFGRGTPAPIHAPKKLVVRGLYRYTRNPMYVGVLTVILGWVVLFQAFNLLIYALCVGIVIHLFIVFYEEPHLKKTFGATYEQYRSRVGRWLPRIGHDPAG